MLASLDSLGGVLAPPQHDDEAALPTLLPPGLRLAREARANAEANSVGSTFFLLADDDDDLRRTVTPLSIVSFWLFWTPLLLDDLLSNSTGRLSDNFLLFVGSLVLMVVVSFSSRSDNNLLCSGLVVRRSASSAATSDLDCSNVSMGILDDMMGCELNDRVYLNSV